MRHSLLWLILAATLGALFPVATSSPTLARNSGNLQENRAVITRVLLEQQAAWNRGDVDAFLDGYWHSPKLTFLGSSGISRGWDGVRSRYRRTYPDRAAMGKLDFSGLEFRFLGPDVALVLGHWHLARKSGDVGGVFSLVWQRGPAGWKIIHDHTSAVASDQSVK